MIPKFFFGKSMLVIFLICLTISSKLFAQAPDMFSYQAVVRNSENQLISNQQVGMRISIIQSSSGGTSVYTETQMPTANINGLISIEIGNGTVVSGNLSIIDWSQGLYFIKTETDPEGGTDYSINGMSQILSVPYAIYAGNGVSGADKTKLDNISDGAEPNIQSDWEQTDVRADDFIKNKPDIPMDINQLNDVNNLLSSLSFSGSFNDLTNIPSNLDIDFSDDFSGDYNDLANKPVIPADLNELTDIDGLLTGSSFSGSFNDLTDVPSNLDTDETDDFSGDYNNLTNQPDLSNYLTSETDPSVPTGTQIGQMQYWNGSAWVTVAAGSTGQILTYINGLPTWLDKDAMVDPTPEQIWKDITSTTGEVWMDRNLGASKVATSSTDAESYGDIYQGGRAADGHQNRTSGTTSTLSSGDAPGHGNFILSPASPYDWRSPQNDNLWQGVNGTNNPCPNGYKLPTEAEWEAERTSWDSNNAAGAFASPLKLPMAGLRSGDNGTLHLVGSYGYYWSRTVAGTASSTLIFASGGAAMSSRYRGLGLTVRCIKD